MKSGKWLLLLFFLLSVPIPLLAERLTWPPSEDNDEPDIIIVGPISGIEVESMNDQESIFWGYLNSTINQLIEDQENLMPETWLENIGTLKKQPWTLSGSTEKEEKTLEAWMVFQTRGRDSGEAYDTELMAEAFTTSYTNLDDEQPELEMGIRLNREKSDYLSYITLDGYRYIYLGPGDGVADWFSHKIDITGKSGDQIKRIILKRLQLLLIMPFHEGPGITQTVPVDIARILYWSDFQTLGILQAVTDRPAPTESAGEDLDAAFKTGSGSQNFEVEVTPITSEFYERCQFLDLCAKADIDDEFVLVPTKAEAKRLCRQQNKYLIDSKSLPFMYLVNDEYLIDFFWVEDREVPVTVIEPVGGIQIMDGIGDDEGMVWCQQTPTKLRTKIDPVNDPTLIVKTSKTVYWHEPDHGYQDGDLIELNGNHVEIIHSDERYSTIVKGRMLYTLNDQLEMNDVDDFSVRVESWVNDFPYKAVFLNTFTTDIELSSEKVKTSIKGIYVTNLGYTKGNRYSAWLWTIGITVFGISYQGETSSGDNTKVKVESPNIGGFMGEIGIERPTYLIPQLRWGLYGGLNLLPVQQTFTQSARGIDEIKSVTLNIQSVSARLHLTVMENLNLFAGLIYIAETEGSFGNSESVYFTKIVIPSGVNPNFGISWLF